MKALTFLFFTQIKNRALALRKKPGMMILYGFVFLFMIAYILFIIFALEKPTYDMNVDNRILFIFLSGFGLLYLFTFTFSGLSTGSTFFTMADVGLLFVAPISTKKILLYGLLSAVGKAMLASLFIFYQIPNLTNMFGYGLMEVLALFLIYVIMVMFCQILSIGVYVYSNGNQNRKNMVRSFLYIFAGILILAVYMIIQKEQVDLLEGVKLLVDRKWFSYLPIMGWVIMFFKGVLTGAVLQVIVSLGLFTLIGALGISLLTAHEADYYEDVLHSTEVTYQRLRDYKEGRNISSTTNRKVKIKEEESGLQKGKGASVFAYKHMLEMRRSGRILFIDNLTILTVIAVGIAGYYIESEISSYVILAILIYLQYFMTVFGRLKIELMKPYIYMIPESSFKKLVAASISSILKPCVDSVIIFGVLALVGGASALECIFMAIAYSSSGAVFVGLTIVYQRVLGGQPNKVAQVFIGIFLMLAIITPAVTVSVIISIYILPESLKFLSTLPYSIISLIFSFIMFFACRNLLDNAERVDQ